MSMPHGDPAVNTLCIHLLTCRCADCTGLLPHSLCFYSRCMVPVGCQCCVPAHSLPCHCCCCCSCFCWQCILGSSKVSGLTTLLSPAWMSTAAGLCLHAPLQRTVLRYHSDEVQPSWCFIHVRNSNTAVPSSAEFPACAPCKLPTPSSCPVASAAAASDHMTSPACEKSAGT